MNTAYLLLGSNIGKREAFLSQAIAGIEKNAGKTTSRSAIYETAPWGNTDQNNFLNQVICIQTKLSAEELLDEILSTEKEIGRKRSSGSMHGEKKWEARTIDVDILFFNSDIIQTSKLTIPHPHLHKRRFALVPLAEIAEDLVHPVLKKTARLLLSECKDPLAVSILTIN